MKPRVKVNLWSGLRSRTGGKQVVEVEASTIGEMLQELVKAYPELDQIVDAGVSVAVDGRVYGYGLTEPINETSEIYLLQRIKGG